MVGLFQSAIANLDNIGKVLANLRQELSTNAGFSGEQSEHWIMALGGTRLWGRQTLWYDIR